MKTKPLANINSSWKCAKMNPTTPNTIIIHTWFTATQAEEGRAKAKRFWATMYDLKVTFH
jgi:hypothetical protein